AGWFGDARRARVRRAERLVGGVPEPLAVERVGRLLVDPGVERETRRVVGDVVLPLGVDLEGDLHEAPAIPAVAEQRRGSHALDAGDGAYGEVASLVAVVVARRVAVAADA